jgi:ADP-dependent NAD(P)H-hydrate dehydratase / NAD(P)H-hydrate epimerase
MTDYRLPKLPERRADAHKGDFGRVLVVAGSRGMVGAACLSASSALRAGAGLVKLAVPKSVWDIAAAKLTCVMTAGWPETADGMFAERAVDALAAEAKWATVVALGPGIGRSGETAGFVRRAVKALELPLVLDADALYHLAGQSDLLAARKAPTVITPHPGEMANLTGTDVSGIQADRVKAASSFAKHARVVCVLKGAGTVVADGTHTYVNTTGNPGMATAGTGDVLTGVIAGLIAQGLSAFDAAALGVYLHGLAGDLAAHKRGTHALIATDLLESLPNAFLTHGGK